MFTSKTNNLSRALMAAVFVAVGGLTIAMGNTPAQAQYYSPGYGNPYYSTYPYHNAYEAHRAWWRWHHQYWRWYHQNYR